MSDAPAALQVIPADEIEAKPPPSDAQLKGVRDHAADLWKARRLLVKLAEEAAKVSLEIEVLETKTLPDAMREIGMRRFELEGGFEVELEDVIHGSVKKEDRPKAFEWLREVGRKTGWDAIIKNTITITFGKGEEKLADKFMRDLGRRKKPIEHEREEAIHAGTLKKFVKERVAEEKLGKVPEGRRLPRDVFGVHEFTKANLVDPAARAAEAAKSSKPRKKKGAASEEVEM